MKWIADILVRTARVARSMALNPIGFFALRAQADRDVRAPSFKPDS
jgi:hypothetical protein